MDIISDLISLLNDSDKKEFVLFLKKKNKRKDVKNIALFSMLETGDIKTNKNRSVLSDKGAYHALRKRLYANLILFLSNKSFEKNNGEAHEALRLLVVSRFLLENQQPKPAFKCLDKAENLAVSLEQYSLLHEILQTKLDYVYWNKRETLSVISTRLMENQEKLMKETRLSIVYASLKDAFMRTQQNGEIIDLKRFIKRTVSEYRISSDDLLNYRSLYQMMSLANEYANIRQNFSLIMPYIETAVRRVNQSESEVPHHLYYHIAVVYYLANFSFRKRMFRESMGYLDLMNVLMQDQDKKYQAVFSTRFRLLQSLNLHFMGRTAEAVGIVEELDRCLTKKAKPEEVADICLCHAMLLSYRQDRLALKKIGRLMHTDAWYEKEMGMLWTIRKNLMEVLLHAQFGNFEYALSRIRSFKRRYRKYLAEAGEGRVWEYAELVEKYLLKPEVVLDSSFAEQIRKMAQDDQNQDVFSLEFLYWFKTESRS